MTDLTPRTGAADAAPARRPRRNVVPIIVLGLVLDAIDHRRLPNHLVGQF